MSHVDLILTGIIAILGATNEAPTTAVVLNASRPTPASNGTTIPAHVAWLSVDATLVASDSAAPDRVLNGQAIYLLRGESIAVARHVPKDLVLVDGVPNNARVVSEENRRFLHWAARMREIWPGEHALNPAYTQRDPDPAMVAARVEINGGELATNYVSDIVWEFRPVKGSTPVTQPLAQQLDYAFDIDGPVILELRKFRSDEMRSIRLTSTSARVRVGNSLEEDIQPSGTHRHLSVDTHFELYYQLFAEPPAERPIPVQVPGAPRPAPRRIQPLSPEGANCPPLILN
jgi:hypothetical protein